jgi:hypothetical protein
MHEKDVRCFPLHNGIGIIRLCITWQPRVRRRSVAMGRTDRHRRHNAANAMEIIWNFPFKEMRLKRVSQ